MKPHLCPTCETNLTSGKRCPECVRANYRTHQFKAAWELVDAVQRYQYMHHRPPTVRELGVILGLSSTSTIQARIKRAVDWGLLIQDKGTARSLHVPEPLEARA
jgi:SOS-response transcriptional repressor LexA